MDVAGIDVVVTVGGTEAESQAERDRTAEYGRAVEGVKQVRNEIQGTGTKTEHSDAGRKSDDGRRNETRIALRPVATGSTVPKEENMNADILKGKWKELKGGIRERWGDLTDDEIDQVGGKEERLLGLLQKKYGYAREEAQREYEEFMERYGQS